MKTELSRNPSFTPNPALRAHLTTHSHGTTYALNELHDRYRLMIELDAIRLTQAEQDDLQTHLQGVVMDEVAIQAIKQDVIETENKGLIKKLEGATFGQLLATLTKYALI